MRYSIKAVTILSMQMQIIQDLMDWNITKVDLLVKQESLFFCEELSMIGTVYPMMYIVSASNVFVLKTKLDVFLFNHHLGMKLLCSKNWALCFWEVLQNHQLCF